MRWPSPNPSPKPFLPFFCSIRLFVFCLCFWCSLKWPLPMKRRPFWENAKTSCLSLGSFLVADVDYLYIIFALLLIVVVH